MMTITDDETVTEVEYDTEPFKLEYGKRYVTDGGMITSPLFEPEVVREEQCYAGTLKETGDGIWTWREDGRTWSGKHYWLVREAKAKECK
jgi:hypothetical protein